MYMHSNYLEKTNKKEVFFPDIFRNCIYHPKGLELNQILCKEKIDDLIRKKYEETPNNIEAVRAKYMRVHLKNNNLNSFSAEKEFQLFNNELKKSHILNTAFALLNQNVNYKQLHNKNTFKNISPLNDKKNLFPIIHPYLKINNSDSPNNHLEFSQINKKYNHTKDEISKYSESLLTNINLARINNKENKKRNLKKT